MAGKRNKSAPLFSFDDEGNVTEISSGETISISTGDCKQPYCHELKRLLKQKDNAINALQLRLSHKQEDDEKAARESPEWAEGVTLWNYYKTVTGHRGNFTRDRFDVLERFLKEFNYDICKMAIDGIAFDPYKRQRKNGTWRVFDDWIKHIFKDRPTFEENCKKSPNYKEPKG